MNGSFTGFDAVALGGLRIDVTSKQDVARRLSQWMQAEDTPRLVVTHNIAHFEQARRFGQLKEANAMSALATADGWPVAKVVSRLSGANVERVTGAEIVEWLCTQPIKIALVGGRGNSAMLAAKTINRMGIARVVQIELVPFGELDDPECRAKLVSRIAASGAHAILIGLGVPKQEALALDVLPKLDSGVVFCVGAAIEFIAGTDQRAPMWVQRSNLEWLHRLVRNPNKLFKRYVVAAPYFVRMVTQRRGAR